MFPKSTLISIGSVIVNLGIGLYICYKLGFVPENEISILADIATFLGPFITVYAIYIAYKTFENQRETNQKNLSSLGLNQLIGEVNEIRRAFDLLSIEVDTQTSLSLQPVTEFESGFKAVQLFLKTYFAGSSGELGQLFYSKLFVSRSVAAKHFTRDVLAQLEAIVRASRKISVQQLTREDKDIARVWLGSLIEIYLDPFDLIFKRIYESLYVVGLEKDRIVMNQNFTIISFYNDAYKKRNTLIGELVKSQFIEKDVIVNFDSNEIEVMLKNRNDYLSENFDNLDYVKYKVKST